MSEREPVRIADITPEERQIAEQRFEEACDAARKKYGVATYDSWKKYEEAWRPLQEAWEQFQKPFFDEMQKEILAASKKRNDELSEFGSKRPPIVERY